MGVEATDTDEARRDTFHYRVAPGGFSPEGWVVVPVATESTPNPAAVAGFQTKVEAQAEANRLNAEADDRRRDDVLRRMLSTPSKRVSPSSRNIGRARH